MRIQNFLLITLLSCGYDPGLPPDRPLVATLTVDVEGSGQVFVGANDLCDRASCTYEVPPHSTVVLIAYPVDSYFAGWSGCANTLETTIAVPVADEVRCVARFEL
jgi:hypothetical protein